LDEAIGVKGKVNGGVYQSSLPRKEPITEEGMSVPPAMGTAIVINFQPTGGGKAATTGGFVVTAEEVNPMIRALRENDNRGDCHPLPYARRTATSLLRSFLGQRRCG
jgi:hypothetical protein